MPAAPWRGDRRHAGRYGLQQGRYCPDAGISRQQLHAILATRKPVSPQTAARLGKLFGNGPGLWLRLQAAYDAWHAEREVDVSAVSSLKLAG
ncbi:HigA family addiction module antitoxin [Chromohalobacter sp.]|uniref:HigA family addiction module antitoxin n=1 Tax=Chromohalobacter TaxID=42054 RepID=UPI001AAE9728